MKKVIGLIISLITGLCVFAFPGGQSIMASDTPLVINIPEGKDAKVVNNVIKLNTENNGSITFTGNTTAGAKIKITKHGGNNRRYTIKADNDGNFSKTLKLASNTKKCNFDIVADDDQNDKSDKTSFSVTNVNYVKPVKSSSVSAVTNSEESKSNADNVSSESTSTSSNGDMRTDQSGMIVGNSRSKIYHTPDQQGYHMNSANAVYFNTESEAQAAGYRKSLRRVNY